MIVTTGAGLTAKVDPRRGAKITSLVDARGVEWLAQADPARASASVGRAFTDAEMAGWDECAPSIVACVVDGRSIPDHGDLWDSEFDVDVDGVAVRGDGDGYTLWRSIEPTPTGLLLSYRARSSGIELPFLWAAHPQFLAPVGTRVDLRGRVDRVVDVLASPPEERPWDANLARIDTVTPGGTRKVYVHPDLDVDGADLVRPDGSSLRMRWSPECRYLGVWFDRCGWSREPVIALEPSTGYYDDLSRAFRAGRVSVLRPGREMTWSIHLSVKPHSSFAEGDGYASHRSSATTGAHQDS